MRFAAVLAASFALAACGEDDSPSPTPRPAPAPPPSARSQTGPEAVRVVRAWVDRLRRGDVKGSARTFAVPSVVQNGPETFRLGSRRAVELWLTGLPCGARLVRTDVQAAYVVGVFRLTNRPGRRCDAPGELAATAFLIRGRRILEWRRVALPDPGRPV